MLVRLLAILAVLVGMNWAQPSCPPTPVYSPCDLVLELNAAEMAAHPNPYLSVKLSAEFRSPGTRTFLLPAFWDGGNRFVVRFAPIDAGKWLVRFSGNIARFQGTMASVDAVDADVPGFLDVANAHHWRNRKDLKPHLWMGDTQYSFATMPEQTFQAILAKRREQGFTHVRGMLLGPRAADAEDAGLASMPSASEINPTHFQQVDRRIRAMNDAGMVVDLVLGLDRGQLAKLLPTKEDRQRYLDYVVGRYSAFRVTWQLVQEFEEYEHGRDFVKELGLYLKSRDPYQHPRTTHTLTTTSPLVKDGWLTYMLYRSADDALGSVEHQLYQVPFVNAEFGYENSGAGAKLPHHVDADAFRSRLWNATMNGQYPTFGNTGTYGGAFPVDARYADSPGAKAMSVWRTLMDRARFWELEPYFDVSGARCVGLHGEDTPEFICYVEDPGPVELRFLKQNKFQVEWINPIDGTVVPQKEFKAAYFEGGPPDLTHDWVLHVYREGRMNSLRSYKFESRLVPIQEPDNAAKRLPFDVAEPTAIEVSTGGTWQAPYELKLERESRATRTMQYLLVAENTVLGEGHRIVGTGPRGFMQFRKEAIGTLPAVVNLRIYGLNAVGKLYFLDKVYKLLP